MLTAGWAAAYGKAPGTGLGWCGCGCGCGAHTHPARACTLASHPTSTCGRRRQTRRDEAPSQGVSMQRGHSRLAWCPLLLPVVHQGASKSASVPRSAPPALTPVLPSTWPGLRQPYVRCSWLSPAPIHPLVLSSSPAPIYRILSPSRGSRTLPAGRHSRGLHARMGGGGMRRQATAQPGQGHAWHEREACTHAVVCRASHASSLQPACQRLPGSAPRGEACVCVCVCV